MSNLRQAFSEPEVHLLTKFDTWMATARPQDEDAMIEAFLAWREEKSRAQNLADYRAGMDAPFINRMTNICRAVIKHGSLTQAEFYSRQRHRRISWPRQLAVYLILKRLRVSTTIVARFFKIDHTTVISSRKAAERNIWNHAWMRALHDAVVAELDGQ